MGRIMSLKPKNIDFDTTWFHLKDTIEGVIAMKKIERHVWNDSFTDVYSLCVAFPEPFTDRIYQETKSFLEQHVQKLKEKILASEENFLYTYHHLWLEFRQGISYLNKLYMHLNAQHIKKHKYTDADLKYGQVEISEQLLEIEELGLEMWKIHVIEPLGAKLTNVILEGIKCDRFGVSGVNFYMFNDIVSSFIVVEEYKGPNSLELYQKIFEKSYLEETTSYCCLEATRFLQLYNCSLYMDKVLALLDAEILRIHKFLHPSSHPKVLKVCEKAFVLDHLEYLQEACEKMIKHESEKDLEHMYLLFKSVSQGIEKLCSELQKHITELGFQAINNLKRDNLPQTFVENLIRVHRKYTRFIKKVFSNDSQFITALDKACSTVINERGSSKISPSPELVAKYTDMLLKKNAKLSNENEMEEKFAHIVILFKYIDDKDVFQKFYSKMLAKRLIYNQSVSMDCEEMMINKLKHVCGYEFTSKLHRMYTDMNVSADLNRHFGMKLRTEAFELGINFNITVLQTGAWPLTESVPSSLALPQALEKSIKKFDEFYNHKFNGRILTWLYHLCNAELKFHYLNKPYLISMNTYFLVVLLMFEASDQLTYTELLEGTKINNEQLDKHLQILVDFKLLQDESQNLKGPFLLNKEYSNKRTKFKISVNPHKETSQEDNEVRQTHATVEEDRKLYLQAAIVRIMKARKILRHNELINEVIFQSKNHFVPNVVMIKKCVESLIDKQYIERTNNSNDEYSYVA